MDSIPAKSIHYVWVVRFSGAATSGLPRNGHADCIERCPVSGVKRKTSARATLINYIAAFLCRRCNRCRAASRASSPRGESRRRPSSKGSVLAWPTHAACAFFRSTRRGISAFLVTRVSRSKRARGGCLSKTFLFERVSLVARLLAARVSLVHSAPRGSI